MLKSAGWNTSARNLQSKVLFGFSKTVFSALRVMPESTLVPSIATEVQDLSWPRPEIRGQGCQGVTRHDGPILVATRTVKRFGAHWGSCFLLFHPFSDNRHWARLCRRCNKMVYMAPTFLEVQLFWRLSCSVAHSARPTLRT